MNDFEVEVEADTEEFEVDEERIQRVVEREYELREKFNKPEPTKVSILDLLVGKFQGMFSRTPLTAQIIQVDSPANNEYVELTCELPGGQETVKRYNTSSNEYANLMEYVNLRQEELFELEGKSLPVLKTNNDFYKINVPDNVALWSKSVHKAIRILMRLGLFHSSFEKIELTERGKGVGLVAQLFVVMATLILLSPIMTTSGGEVTATGEFAGMILILSTIGAMFGVIFLVGKPLYRYWKKFREGKTDHSPF